MKKFFFICICSVGFASAALAQPQKIVADKIIGIVGSKIILQSDIKNAIADIVRQGGQVPENAECTIMDQALIQKVLAMQAEKDSLPVTDADVEAELDQKVRYYIKMYGSQAQVEAMAGKTIYQIKDEARESVKEQKLAEAMQRKIVDNVKITPTEVKAYYDRIPKDSLPFFESQLEVGQIVVYPKASPDMENYVIGELNNYKKQIASKTVTFDQLAKRVSQDPGSKDRGGLYEMNRNDKTWDPNFKSAAFRLKDGEISDVVKTQFGYHIIQMVERNGDEAQVRHILLIPPVTDDEVNASVHKLDTVRANLIAGKMDFNTAAGKYSDDPAEKYQGPFMVGRTGESFVTIDELDKSIVAMLDKLKVGEISQPISYTDESGKKAVRLIYLKSKSQPHRLNMQDDYNRISNAALEEKKYKALEKWLTAHAADYYIMIDPSEASCPQLKKWNTQTVATKQGL